ncbi:MAG: tail fiber protein [Candidatus Saccharimonadaceae bacterium]
MIRKKGFTIVELLVVIAVIGILSVVTVVGLIQYQRLSRDSQRVARVTVLAEALEKYYDANGEYPSCPAMSNTDADVVTNVTLRGLDKLVLLTPTIASAATATNSITCTPLTLGTDAFAYLGDGSIACISGAACLNWKLEYLSEQSNEIQFLTSRRNTVISTSGTSTLSATPLSSKEINLTWTAVSNAISYTVQYSTDNSFLTNLQEKTVESTATTVNGLSPMTEYFFRVRPNASGSIGNWSNTAAATTENNYGSLAVGSSIEGYWTLVPQGFLLENGQAISRTTYANLFAIIGTTYGSGDGSTTFNVPDSRGRATVTRNASDVEFATIGQKTGSKTEVLTIAQMPSHTHTQNAHTHGVSDPGHNHSQNAHTHSQNVSNPLSGGGGIRSDYNGDRPGGNYTHGTPTDNAWPTNNPSLTGVSFGATAATNQSTGGSSGHNNIQPSIVKVSAIKYTLADIGAGTYPAASTIQGYWTTVPTGYALEDGAAVSRTTYADLFASIGTTYGAGNGSTTFNLPDSRGRIGVNKSTDTEFDTMGEKTGSKIVILTIAQIPSHTHIQNAHTHGVSDPGHNHIQNPHSHGMEVSANGGPSTRSDWNSDGPAGTYSQDVLADLAVGTNNPSLTGVTVVGATATNQATGGDSAHNEIQPSIAKQSAIKLTAADTGDGERVVAAGTSVSGWWPAVPSGYLIENGQAVSRTTYADLFAVVGTTYGAGDSSTTFNLPDSRGRVGVNKSTDTEFDTMGEKTGSKTEILSIAQMPSHTHIQNAHTHGVSDPGHNHTQNGHVHMQHVTNPLAGGGGEGSRVDYDTDAQGAFYSQGITTTTTTATNNPSATGISLVNTTATNLNNGGGGAHNNLQPSITKLFVIKI